MSFCPIAVMKLRASDGALLGTFVVGTGPSALAFDGSSIWPATAAVRCRRPRRPSCRARP